MGTIKSGYVALLRSSARNVIFKACRDSVFARFWLLAVLLGAEAAAVTMVHHPWLQGSTRTFAITFYFIAALFFGNKKVRALDDRVPSIRKLWIGLNVVDLILFATITFYLLNVATGTSNSRVQGIRLWFTSLAFLPITLIQGTLGFRRLYRVVCALGNAWVTAAICVGMMVFTRQNLMTAWDTPDSRLGQAMQALAFNAVKVTLNLLYNDVFANPTNFTVGTTRFPVQISGLCSGLEGLALGLSLALIWLIYSRRHLRLVRAWILIPLFLLSLWFLNILRIVALIAIGTVGFPMVAVGGFHSEAGGLLFSCASVGFLLVVNKVGWFRSEPDPQQPSIAYIGAEAKKVYAEVYLLPFLGILAAGMVAGAASNGFERLYFLRLIAAAIALWFYRRQYLRMDWQFGWLGPTAGCLVFAFWIWFDRANSGGSSSNASNLVPVTEGLAQLTIGPRLVWITVRTMAAIVTVPIAEELAFRGYVARRLQSSDVESVKYAKLALIPILGSSLAFGALHGRFWLPGTVAGIIFAIVAKLRGRLGEAVAAHATANLCLAFWIITRHEYQLW